MSKRLILMLAICPLPALAQKAVVDSSIVSACFEIATEGGGTTDCAGMAARLCQSREGETTAGISSCAMAEASAWDEMLNREYKLTRDHYVDIPGIGDKLTSAQKAWIGLRDADCGIANDRWQEGSLRSVAAANCQLQHTARRAVDLWEMRQP